MKLKYLISLAIVIICFICCTKDSTIDNPDVSQNLILNSSFELLCDSSLENWKVLRNDNDLVSFSKDVPPGGGCRSIKITPAYHRNPIVVQYFTNIEGTYNYYVNAQAKSLLGLKGGKLNIGISTEDTVIFYGGINIDDSGTWKNYELTSTITSQRKDSILIAIGSSQCEICYEGSAVLFDLIKLRKD